ncbi:BTAD domain-containing putative transcriptional regulator [Pseudonocardia sichuanensis]|uniref:Transcriptional regulator n=1 Tax=Pseudonocardia kunmingensis TaxID=630975 RepID=A0A543D9K5_9PSEU|nr:BTAD domain-containing putative transcriptional regulator [Pseudonocardia kunmingensis]TQM06021.1 transcriptional regulator [Pseudonocardia kunmingensis]
MRALVAVAALAVLVGGVPWALWRYIGWPLPTRAPTLPEVQVVLLGPMHSTLLLDVLACVCWIVWAAFSVDVARCARDAVHGMRMPSALAVRTSRSPTHAVAALLVGAIAISILGNRAAAHLHTGTPPGEQRGDTGTATSAPTWHIPPPIPIIGDPAQAGLRTAGFLVGQAHDPGQQDPRQQDPGQQDPRQQDPGPEESAVPDSVVVRAPDPRTGIHDSLWRIADRTLGEGARWPEIFELNQGKPQPDGGTLVRPSLIFPGEELRLPDLGPDPGRGDEPPSPVMPVPEQPGTSNPQQPGEAVPALPDSTALPEDVAPPGHLPDRVPEVAAPADPGLSWGTEMYVGIGLASAISAALLAARRRHRRRYRPGSGRRDDLPVAPVIYQLRLAHLRTGQDPDREDQRNRPDAAGHDSPARHTGWGLADTGDPDDAEICDNEIRDGALGSDLDDLHDLDAEESGPAWSGDTSDRAGAGAGAGAPVVGTRGGRGLALDLAVTRGLGLVGPGAAASARALLIDTLAALRDRDSAGCVMVPVGDLAALLGPAGAAADPPAALRTTETLDDALDELDAVILARTDEHDPADPADPVVLLVARPEQLHRAQLQSILDNGSSVGIVGILLGQWQPGVTAYVNEDGTVSATSPGAGEALRGTRLFHLGETETSQLLTLLHRAQPETVDPALPDPDLSDPDLDFSDPAPADQESDAPGADGPESDDQAGGLPDLPTRPVTDLSPRPHPEGSTEFPAVPTASAEGPAPMERTIGDAAAGNDPKPGDRAPVRITVLGRPQVHWRPDPDTAGGSGEEREITGALQPRTRELLTFLALHPEGARREELADSLWPESPPGRTTSSMNSALTRLRRALDDATQGAVLDIVLAGDGRVRLDPTMVDVDFWDFDAAVTARRGATTTGQRHDAHQRLVDAYGGTLADGMTAAWIEPVRESVRRTALDAVVALARELHDTDPQQTLDLLETARAFDPYNESVYRTIMRLQSTLGLLDAIPRTLALLATRLAEFGDRPAADTLALAEQAAQPPNRPGNVPPTSPRPDHPTQPGPPAIGRRRAG